MNGLELTGQDLAGGATSGARPGIARDPSRVRPVSPSVPQTYAKAYQSLQSWQAIAKDNASWM